MLNVKSVCTDVTLLSERKNRIIIEKYVEHKNLNQIEKFIKFDQSNTFARENLMKPQEAEGNGPSPDF